MFVLLGFFINLLDMFVLYHIIKKFTTKFNNKVHVHFSFIIIASLILTFFKFNIYMNNIFVIWLTFFIVYSLIYRSKRVIIFMITLWFIIWQASEWLGIIILRQITGKDMQTIYEEKGLSVVLALVLSVIIKYSISYLLVSIKININIEQVFSLNQYLFIAMVMVVLLNSIYMFELIQDKTEISEEFVVYYFTCLAIMFFQAIYLFIKLVQILNENEEARILKLNTNTQKVFIEEINILVEHFKQLNHDYRHHIQLLYVVVKKYDKIENLNYVKELLEESDSISLGFIENQIAISLLLFQKAKKAKNKNIAFECNVPDTLNVKIKETELNVIISNLLENAFEATSKLELNKKIRFDMSTSRDMLYIKMKNTFNGDIKMKNGAYMTIKRNLDFHGYGLKSVERIVKSYDGLFKTQKTDELFTVIISIPV